MFKIGDRVRRKDGKYTGTVVGVLEGPGYVRVERDDGVVGNSGLFWQTDAWRHELLDEPFLWRMNNAL